MVSHKAVDAKDAWYPMTRKERRFGYKELVYETNRHLCICETLRFIYDDIINMKDSPKKRRITNRLIDALIMGKKMASRLTYYRKKYEDKTGSGGKNLVYILDSKKRRDMRWKRKR